jgi:meiotic recombination protein SPO11
MKDIRKDIKDEVEHILKGHIDESALRKIRFLNSIYNLLNSGENMNKRTLFYDSVPIFQKQENVNWLVKKYSAYFGCEQSDFNLKSSLKGLFSGSVVFILKNGKYVKHEGKGLIPDMDEVVSIEHTYKTVLVIEKDTIFSKINDSPFLIVCGKGYPCRNTVKFLKMIEETNENKVKFYCLTDFDPHGLHIFMVYKEKIKNMIRIGLSVEDILEYKVNKEDCIKLKKTDMKMIEKLRRDPEVKGEIEFIEGLGMKMELEILFNRKDFKSFEYFEKLL